jgi:hypothetical protein
MATVADLSPAFVNRQRKLFDAVVSVPISSYELVAKWDRLGDMARPTDVARYPEAGAVAIPVTEERYRIKGFDRAPAVEDLYLTFVEVGGRWLVAEDSDLADVGLRSTRHLWEQRAVEARRAPHLLLLSHPCPSGAPCPAQAHDYLGLAQTALRRVGHYWTQPWDKRLVMMVPDDPAELKAMIQATFDIENFVAFAYSTVDVEEGLRYTGHRILVNPPGFTGRSAATVVEILAHEMLHVATRSVSGPFLPVWVDEGLADYVGSDASPTALAFFDERVAQGLFTGVLPEDYRFTTGTADQIYFSYQSAQSAVRFFISRYGLGTFERFYRLLGRQRITVGTARFHLDRALRRTTGRGFEAFQSAWADSIL